MPKRLGPHGPGLERVVAAEGIAARALLQTWEPPRNVRAQREDLSPSCSRIGERGESTLTTPVERCARAAARADGGLLGVIHRFPGSGQIAIRLAQHLDRLGAARSGVAQLQSRFDRSVP